MMCTVMLNKTTIYMGYTAIKSGERIGNNKRALMMVWVNKLKVGRLKIEILTIWNLWQ